MNMLSNSTAAPAPSISPATAPTIDARFNPAGLHQFSITDLHFFWQTLDRLMVALNQASHDPRGWGEKDGQPCGTVASDKLEDLFEFIAVIATAAIDEARERTLAPDDYEGHRVRAWMLLQEASGFMDSLHSLVAMAATQAEAVSAAEFKRRHREARS